MLRRAYTPRLTGIYYLYTIEDNKQAPTVSTQESTVSANKSEMHYKHGTGSVIKYIDYYFKTYVNEDLLDDDKTLLCNKKSAQVCSQ